SRAARRRPHASAGEAGEKVNPDGTIVPVALGGHLFLFLVLHVLAYKYGAAPGQGRRKKHVDDDGQTWTYHDGIADVGASGAVAEGVAEASVAAEAASAAVAVSEATGHREVGKHDIHQGRR
ncbi:MAG: hypothetical protein MI785_25215, partial [Kiloniellales bacterium]|nr:hypothetical protein [Kiloniellales bacterium]